MGKLDLLDVLILVLPPLLRVDGAVLLRFHLAGSVARGLRAEMMLVAHLLLFIFIVILMDDLPLIKVLHLTALII